MVHIILYHRHYGKHSPIKDTFVRGRYESFVAKIPDAHDTEYFVDEKKLIDRLPDDFLPKKCLGSCKCQNPLRHILLMIGDMHSSYSIMYPIIFGRWGKYFDAYSLGICRGCDKCKSPHTLRRYKSNNIRY